MLISRESSDVKALQRLLLIKAMEMVMASLKYLYTYIHSSRISMVKTKRVQLGINGRQRGTSLANQASALHFHPKVTKLAKLWSPG